MNWELLQWLMIMCAAHKIITLYNYIRMVRVSAYINAIILEINLHFQYQNRSYKWAEK